MNESDKLVMTCVKGLDIDLLREPVERRPVERGTWNVDREPQDTLIMELLAENKTLKQQIRSTNHG